jgi:hypothetical protein
VGCYGQINEEIEEERAPWFTKRDQEGLPTAALISATI